MATIMVSAATFPSASLPAAASLAPERGQSSPSSARDPVADRQAGDRQAGTGGLDAEARVAVRRLQARDSQVRRHELAHLVAAGGLVTSGPSYVYERGPDGINYAVGGEVTIDTSPGRTPQDTIERAQTIVAAALAPADPSGADRAVALQAQAMLAEAQSALQRQRLEEQSRTAAKAYAAADRTASQNSRVDVYA